jgi:hypothetical protein
MKIIFELEVDKINKIQFKTIRRTIERAKHAHYTNIHLRINGKDEYEEADWLKHLVEIGTMVKES